MSPSTHGLRLVSTDDIRPGSGVSRSSRLYSSVVIYASTYSLVVPTVSQPSRTRHTEGGSSSISLCRRELLWRLPCFTRSNSVSKNFFVKCIFERHLNCLTVTEYGKEDEVLTRGKG